MSNVLVASATTGFWGVPTSTIDWCEQNYEITIYICEFWNCISSLVISAAGAMNLYSCYKDGLERRFALMSLAIVIVGLGSAAFHGTLQYSAQMLDELPMVYAMCVWCFIWIQLYVKPGKPAIALTIGGIAFSIAVTLIHSYFGFIVIFQASFGLMVIFGFYNVAIYYVNGRNASGPQAVLAGTYIALVLVAFGCWLVDMHACGTVSDPRILPSNPQLHAWWHVLNGFSCFMALPLALHARCMALGYSSRVSFERWKVLPTIVAPKKMWLPFRD